MVEYPHRRKTLHLRGERRYYRLFDLPTASEKLPSIVLRDPYYGLAIIAQSTGTDLIMCNLENATIRAAALAAAKLPLRNAVEVDVTGDGRQRLMIVFQKEPGIGEFYAT
jgi:hypothetical protein